MTVRNYRFKRQTNRMGVFVGVIAEGVRADGPPPGLEAVTDRLWLDVGRVVEGFRGTPLRLTRDEIGWLRTGLEHVAADIARAEPVRHVVVVLRAVEIFEVDYIEEALAPAVAGWAAAEFGFPIGRAEIRRDEQTGRCVVDW
ncbi:hypothetical protein [Actinoplanes utahensis]|uniref:hypothetical protein n=1 Tax=Actinoplanes utahensis TaxID=1869 RepID=UPI00069100EA|nr:hypothetical protein [Actinoplanes utahensis]GIF32346.1 hypothetical protein Aut01nite_53320 [Actinoplanes utahensis]